jgi:hypothetical protein
MEIVQKIALYQDVLDDKLSALDTYYEATQNLIVAAQSATDYKAKKSNES